MDTGTFADRRAAGVALAHRLRDAVRTDVASADVLVLGLARGGVPVAREVADILGGQLDVLVVRKLGAPGQPEYAIGAIAGGEIVVNDDAPRRLGVSENDFDTIVAREDRVRREREAQYRQGRAALSPSGRITILVDDGLATGASMAAAVRAMRAAGAESVVVAVPTAPSDTLANFRTDPAVSAVVCVTTPEPFRAVGQSYDDFHQVDDDEVTRCLRDR